MRNIFLVIGLIMATVGYVREHKETVVKKNIVEIAKVFIDCAE